jgi:hypothetical protein
MQDAHNPTDEDVNAIAAAVGADPRTVVRRLAGLPVRTRIIQRAIDQAIADRFGSASRPSSVEGA